MGKHYEETSGQSFKAPVYATKEGRLYKKSGEMLRQYYEDGTLERLTNTYSRIMNNYNKRK